MIDEHQRWVDVITLGTSEIASTLRLGAAQRTKSAMLDGTVVEGADVALEGNEAGYIIRFRCDAGQSKTLTARLLRLPPDMEPDEEDVADALCELSNIMAGKVKAGLRRVVRGLRIGLPVYFPATAQQTSPRLAVCFDVDGVPLRVEVVEREAA